MPAELSLNAAGMDGGGANSALAVTSVERYRKQNVCGLRPAVCYERIVRRPLEACVVQIDVRKAMTRRSEIDQPSTRCNERRDTIHQDEMTQVVRTKLRFKTIRGVAKGCRHHAGIRNDRIERVALLQQAVGARANASEV